MIGDIHKVYPLRTFLHCAITLFFISITNTKGYTMKLIGFILFYIRFTKDGQSIIWSTAKAQTTHGTMGSGRIWSMPAPDAPPAQYWSTDTRYSSDDMDGLVAAGMGTINVNLETGEVLTMPETQARLQQPTAPPVTVDNAIPIPTAVPTVTAQ